MQNKKVAIHQPNFFPWLGFFDKIARCDTFVYLDHVRMNTNQIWTKRVKLLISGKPDWLTVPLKRAPDDEFPKIIDITIDNSKDFSIKHIRTIEQNYGKTRFFNEIFPFCLDFYNNDNPKIAERNFAFIEVICNSLNINTLRFRSSAMELSATSTELLIEIAKRTGCDLYLCGGGASGYQEDEKFSEAGIKLVYQNFVHPEYEQYNTKEFHPGLSVLDALFNIGIEGVSELLKAK
ncbi:MAG: wbmP [Ignavibacteria bacterium]|nr:wbmP [Ignavibacteria bacterium]